MLDSKSPPLEKSPSSERDSTSVHTHSEREWQGWGAIDKTRE